MEQPAHRLAIAAGTSFGSACRLILPRESMRGRSGARLGSNVGSSLDFHDYREYHQGDDLRHLDWSVYARSDREVIKLYREEVSPCVDIVLDISRSMELGGADKADSALFVCAAIASSAAGSGCVSNIWYAGEKVECAFSVGRSQLQEWPLPVFSSCSTPVESFVASSPHFCRNSIRVFISDLLWPGSPESVISRLADGASALFVIQLLSADESEPPLPGHYRLDDVETGEELDVFIDAASASAYRTRLADHCNEWSRGCKRVGAVFAEMTGAPIDKICRLEVLERCGLLEMT